MTEKKEYIEREALVQRLAVSPLLSQMRASCFLKEGVLDIIQKFPAADVVEVVRCHDCVHAVPLDRNCELNPSAYMHCNLWRGDPTQNVWHKYKRYYKDYSIVEHYDFCSYGERKE